MFVVQVDPDPVLLSRWVEKVGGKPHTWIARHTKGQFPCLRKIGGEWFVLPAAVVKWSLEDGNPTEERELESNLAESRDSEAGELREPDKPGGRGAKKSGKDSGLESHPLSEWRQTA